ncbi:MAG: pyridoxamine 5'-phosphate oxidase family protein [Candidatus Dormibacteraeota bacterium]|nr:pyridoxamine 5'-phosphate oxidase family protein [Candidatus Dormibacteraeota bacterium]
MPDSKDAIRSYLAAVSAPSEESAQAAAPGLADEVVVAGTLGPATGKAAVLAALAKLPQPGLLAGAEWSEPELDTEVAMVEGKLPPGMPFAAMSFRFRLDAAGKITRVEQRSVAGPPPPFTELALTDDIKSAVNGALANGTPMLLSYVDSQGSPHLSFRGSTQVYSDDQLAVWVRDPEGGVLGAVATNPRVAMLYRDPKTRRSYQFAGRAHVAEDPAVVDRVYACTPELERNMDAQRRGRALIIDLDRVEGMGGGVRVRMERR